MKSAEEPVLEEGTVATPFNTKLKEVAPIPPIHDTCNVEYVNDRVRLGADGGIVAGEVRITQGDDEIEPAELVDVIMRV